MAKSRLADPAGKIAGIRAKLNPRCAVRKSRYCEILISQFLQGMPYQEMEAWTERQGPEHRISTTTIWRNFMKAGLAASKTMVEEQVEANGGVIHLDLVREAKQNILMQKQRIDHLVRSETEKRTRQGFEHYHDKRIAQEIKLQQEMIAALAKMIADETHLHPEDAEETKARQSPLHLSEEAKPVLADMLINEEIKLLTYDPLPSSTTQH